MTIEQIVALVILVVILGFAYLAYRISTTQDDQQEGPKAEE
ncbi:MAG TPA: hypothetical protein VGK02_12385 [Candidatus Aquicultor sp.]